MEEVKKFDTQNIQNYAVSYHKIAEKVEYIYKLAVLSKKICDCGVVAADFETNTFVVTKNAFKEYFPNFEGNQMNFMGINIVKEEK